eukprot:7193444-Prorocentrum_lima.AAC.1
MRRLLRWGLLPGVASPAGATQGRFPPSCLPGVASPADATQGHFPPSCPVSYTHLRAHEPRRHL